MSVVDMTWGDTTGTLEADYWVMPTPGSAKGSVNVDNEFIGSVGRKASGAFRGTYIAEKDKVRVVWVGLTATELAIIQAAYDAFVSGSAGEKIVLPDGSTFTSMRPIPASFKKAHDYVYSGTDVRYHVTLEFWEV